MTRGIVFAHLLNDRSGSPKVLASAIAALCEHQTDRLFIGSDGSGWLDKSAILTTRYWYRRTPYRVGTLFTYLLSQAALFLALVRDRDIRPDAVVYVNTLLPFGAALYGRLTDRPVVYHLHELSLSPAPLRWFLTTIARHTADYLIYVSDFHRNCLPISSVPATTVYNALDETLTCRGQETPYHHRRSGCFRILMLASLRDYKGIPELVELAKRFKACADIHFDLVANDDEHTTKRYFADLGAPPNLTVHPRTDDPATHYARASLVLNLSRPGEWVETFGLTLLEAMAFGIPVIAPPVGGPVELVTDGVEGFLVDCRQIDTLAEKVQELASDEGLCLQMSAAARLRASTFSQREFVNGLRRALHLVAVK